MIKGNKVGLRALEKQDLDLLKDWRNISTFRKNFREVRELSLADQQAWYESLQQTKHINFMFVIVDLKSNANTCSVICTYIYSLQLLGQRTCIH